MQANQKRLYQHVDFLTSIYPYRNYKNVQSLDKAATYIQKEFNKSNLEVSTQEWKAKGNTYQNIIASFQPDKKQRFIIGAHYDVYKDVPGADDNASSVAGLLELAYMINDQDITIDYGIDLVAFSLEEPPFFKTDKMGSYIHAQTVYAKQQDIIGMLSLEMIGFYQSKEKRTLTNKNYLFVSGIKKFDAFNTKISELLRTTTSLGSRRISYANNYRNNGPSDHRNYWKYDYPAAMVIGSGNERNPHYHKVSDTIETLDFRVMTEAVNSIAYAIFNFQ